MKKFVLVSDRQRWGGTIAIHKLCQLLRKKGYDARIFYTRHTVTKDSDMTGFWERWKKENKEATRLKFLVKTGLYRRRKYRHEDFRGFDYEPVKGYRRTFSSTVSDDTIVVYPEKFYGNFLNAKNVVRWLMYYHPYQDDPSAYGKNDLFFAYREIYNDEKLNPQKRLLTIVNFDDRLYRQTNFKKRTGCCYCIRKGKERADLPKEFDGPIIDELPEKEKVRLFNQCKYCYFYDTATFYSMIAAVCGCISVVVCEPGKTRADYLEDGVEHWGVAYSSAPEEIEYAVRTRGRLVDEYLGSMRKANEENVGNFLEECDRYFGNVKK